MRLDGTVPDGLALDADGGVLVSCYRPDRIYHLDPAGELTVVADDPQGTLLAAPTNVCFAGEELDRLVCANLGRWHLTAIDDTGLRGAPLHRPSLATEGVDMKLGLLTAAFPDLTLDEVAGWAAGHGFETLEVACWPSSGGERRRYAGVTHIDVESFDPDDVRATLDRHGLGVSALAYYPNNLDPDDEQREHVNAHLRKVIDAAQRLGVDTVGTFVGNDKDSPLPENLERFRRIWPPLVHYAGERGVKVAIENCPMIFSWDEWPGGTNLAWSPAIWDEMFGAIPDENFGLNLDPSHLVWLMIDYERAVYDYADAHLPRPREGSRGAHGRPVPARHALGGHGLAGAAASRPRRGELATLRRGPLRRGLRRRDLGRARGQALRRRRRPREARLPHRAQHPQAAHRLIRSDRART